MALLLLAAGLGQEAAAQTVVRGPYLQQLGPDSVVVRWRTDSATASTVRYGASPDALSATAGSSGLTTEHEVRVTGLDPDTRYYYAVGTPDEMLAGGDAGHSFATAPEPGTAKPTRIWVVGDSGTANANARAVRDAYKAYTGSRGTDLWLMLGDNAYPDGTDSEYQSAVFDMYPELLRQVVLWPTLGNHDGHTADSVAQSGPYYGIFTLPTKGEAGGTASGTEAYYSFDYGNIHFVVLDSFDSDRSSTSTMMTWLENDLAANDKQWVIAFWHHPPYSKGSHDSDTEGRLVDMRENALPILEAYGVDLVLSGHSHSYERSYLLDGHYGTSDTLEPSMILDGGDGRDDGDGTYVKPSGAGAAHDGAVYAVAGSSGKVSSAPLNHPVMFVSLLELGSMVLDVYGDRLDAVFLGADGAVKGHFTIEKGPVDITPPAIVSVDALDATGISVLFAERLDPFSAETAGNYAVDNGVSIRTATLLSDEKTVEFDTLSLTEGVVHTLTVNNVQDLAGNTIEADSQARFTYVTVVTAGFRDGAAPTAGYAGTRDTTISEAEPSKNFGGATALLVDGDDPGGTGLDLSTLLSWDLSDIPSDALVESATLTVNVTNVSGATYGIFEAGRDWLEDEATWHDYAAGRAWTGAEASGAGDRGALLLGTISAGVTGAHSVALNAEGVAVVQGWVDGTRPNRGFVIANSRAGDGLDSSSREAGAAGSRPRLTITYGLPPTGDGLEPPTAPTNLRLAAKTADSVALAWDPSTDDVGVAGYKLYRDGQVVHTGAATSHQDTGLSPGTSYTYDATAYDAANNESARSRPLTVSTEPSPGLTVNVVDVGLRLRRIGKHFVAARAEVAVLGSGGQPVAGAVVTGAWSGLTNGAASGVTGSDGTVELESDKVRSPDGGRFVLTATDVTADGYAYAPEHNVETSDCIAADGASCE